MQTRTQLRGFTIGLLSLSLLAGVAMTASPAQAEEESDFQLSNSARNGKISTSIRSG
jgi:hypothetical protein